jgi:hypothetical protein
LSILCSLADPLAQLRALEPRPPRGWLLAAGTAIARARFLYLPLALFALVAVGVHAAADTLDDRILWGVDHLDAAFDAVVGGWTWTRSWVHWIDLGDRVRISRALALLWELAADGFLAFPILGYREQEPRKSDWAAWLGATPRRLRDQWLDVVRRPTVMRVTRPLCAAAVVLAGAFAIGRRVHAALYLGLRALLGDGSGAFVSRGLGGLAVLCVLAAFGLRVVLGHLRRADALAQEELPDHPVKARAHGLVGAVVIVPLALAALFLAIPWLAFFR